MSVAARRTPIALSIAGSDPSGGAGIQADLKTFSALGVYGAAAITALTAQNTCGVREVLDLAPRFVAAEIEAVLSDLRVDAIKIGMLSQAAIVAAVAAVLARWPQIRVVLDPVMVSKSGTVLLQREAVAALKRELLPRATLLTPNIPEVAVLLDVDEEVVQRDLFGAAERLLGLGAHAVLIKGGHAVPCQSMQAQDACSDDFFLDGERGERLTLSSPRLLTPNTHGTGCTLSSAIAAFLARGCSLAQAVTEAKAYLYEAIAAADSLVLNGAEGADAEKGGKRQRHGPVHHFFALWPQREKSQASD